MNKNHDLKNKVMVANLLRSKLKNYNYTAQSQPPTLTIIEASSFIKGEYLIVFHKL